MINLLQYDFIVRGLIAGLIIAVIAPAIGVFLVLKRYSLIADTLSHVSLAGIAIGLLAKVNPLLTATIATVLSSVVIDKLRLSRKVYGESALALFLSGSLAVAVVLISISHGFNSALFNFLFGSIATVTLKDIYAVGTLAVIVLILLLIIYNELFFITFDEDAARVSGIRVDAINTVFIILAAITISLAIPIVGVLLISSLLVIPVISALQFRRSLLPTIFIAQLFSTISVVAGIVLSFYFDLAPGGTIVLVGLLIFVIVNLFAKNNA